MEPQDESLSVGIDFGGTSVKIGLCRGAEIVARPAPIPTREFDGPEALIDAMAARVGALVSEFRGIRSVGIGVPGFVDEATGHVHRLTNVPGWVEIPLRRILEDVTGLPAKAENDANCMTWAEYRLGAGRGARNLVAVTLGTGVGGGLILDGRLFHGSASGAGEIGQMSVDHRGRAGTYGNTGALEEYVGNNEIAARARKLYREAGRTIGESDCSPAALAAAAREGDAVALRMWDEIAGYLACGLSNCVWLLNPDVIVIGGGIARAGRVLFDPLREKLRNRLADTFRKELKVVPARFGNDAGIIGSAAVARSAAAEEEAVAAGELAR